MLFEPVRYYQHPAIEKIDHQYLSFQYVSRVIDLRLIYYNDFSQFVFSIPISLSQSPRRSCHVVATGDGLLVLGLIPKPCPPVA